MKVIIQVARDEWRYWRRTKLAISALVLALLLSVVSALVNGIKMMEVEHQRAHLQQASESRFLQQPDRHPHRMVHYGHYVFRAPSALSAVEPGVDEFTGTTIFLEGHRQNSAAFSDQRQASGMTRFSSLTPSFLLQVLVPLFLILVGYASVVREKEAGTLQIMISQGLTVGQLLLGKYLALVLAGAVLLLPLVAASLWAVSRGENSLLTLSFLFGYSLYILIFSGLVIAVSTWSKSSKASFATLSACWILLCLLIPRIASSSAAAIVPSAGKLEADFAVLEQLRKLGDGHNAADPAFEKLKNNLLAKYGVDSVEQLPINFRGTVASYSEQKLTQVLNQFAEQRMSEELAQAEVARQFGWFTPTAAVRSFSMMLAGTSLETHHRFLREAEALRFDFVQSLNQLHQDQLDYQADINRHVDDQAARLDASNWAVLSSFSFSTDPAATRMVKGLPYLLQLLLWFVLSIAFMRFASGKLI